MNSNMDKAINAIVAVLAEIEANAGKEGYRHPFDKGLHIYCALKQAGLKVVKDPQYKPEPKTLCEVLAAQPSPR